jgi:hypothetical protein
MAAIKSVRTGMEIDFTLETIMTFTHNYITIYDCYLNTM